MLSALAVGLPVMMVCLAIQAALTGVALQHYLRNFADKTARMKLPQVVRMLMAIMLIMMLANTLQITIWGLLFVWLGEFSDPTEAIYHSAVNYASLGYGDIVMSKDWKILGPLEAVNGVLMCGMTAGVLMAVLQVQFKHVMNRT
jgi:hypothetical protein